MTRHLLSTAALSLLLGTAGVAVFTPQPAMAQMSDEEDRKRSRQTLNPRTGAKMAEAFNFINEDPPRLREALAILDQLAAQDIPAYDMATVKEIRAIVRFQLDNTNGAIADYVDAINSNTLPREREAQARRTVAQLYYQEERFDEAIRFMNEYIRAAGDGATSNDYFILAGAYYQKGDYRSARAPAEAALRLDTKRNQQYYDFLNIVYLELGLKSERGELLETMVEYFPGEEPYWSQLSNVYSEANRPRDAFSTLWAAYRAGIVEDEDKIIALAQYYYSLDNPYPGAQMLEREMNAGKVRRNLNNLKLLSQLWAAAREQTKAIEILTEAAPKSSSGDLYYQLGQSYVADEQWAKAIQALRQALDKGGLNSREQGNIWLLIGTAYQSIDDETAEGRRNSLNAYRNATRYSSSKAQAERYINYIRQVQKVECQQDERERIQEVDRQQRAIDRCRGILDVIALGGAIQSSDEEIAECETLVAKVEAGASAEDIVNEVLGELDRSQCVAE